MALYYWQWQNKCFDSIWVPPFCAFMAVWCTLYLEFWKRKTASLALEWGVTDYDDEAKLQAIANLEV